jgi:hypothetical protein
MQNLYSRSDLNQGDADGATNSRTGAIGAMGNLRRRAEHFPAAVNCGSKGLARNLSAACVAARVVNDRFDGFWKSGSAWGQAPLRSTSRGGGASWRSARPHEIRVRMGSKDAVKANVEGTMGRRSAQ